MSAAVCTFCDGTKRVMEQLEYDRLPVEVPCPLCGYPKPCAGCGSTTAPRSACPSCGKVFCQPCAERPYEFCCDGKGAEA